MKRERPTKKEKKLTKRENVFDKKNKRKRLPTDADQKYVTVTPGP